MDPFVGSAVMGTAGGLLGFFGQRETNAANMQMAEAANRILS